MSILPPSSTSPSNYNSSSNYNSGVSDSKKASLLPLIFGSLSILVSIAIWALYQGKAVSFYFYLTGYLLTPFAVVVMMGWDTIAQRKAISSDPWFIPRPRFSRILRVLTALSFIVALPHIWRLAQIIADFVPVPIVDFLLRVGG